MRSIVSACVMCLIGVLGISSPKPASAYQVDCAILLCLAGGWPPSTPCAHARAVFIRRITPWPIEPPLQIWRCPMGAAYTVDPETLTADRIYDILFELDAKDSTAPLPAIAAHSWPETPVEPHTAVLQIIDARPSEITMPLLHLIQSQGADIDISDPAFDFVRSIRLYHVEYAYARESDKGECRTGSSVRLGLYGEQGDFRWYRSSVSALPDAHHGLEGFNSGQCSGSWGYRHRSVFVDWRDHEGTYDYEQVNY